MHYLYEWHKNGYDSLPKPGTTLGTDELAALFPDETGVRSWSPVEVREGDGWEGIWLAPKSPLIPTEVDPYAQNQWGNYMYFLDKGSFPEK
jgi:hypothetical protein